MSYNTRTFQKASLSPLGASRRSQTRGQHERAEGKTNKAQLLANFSPREAMKVGSMAAQNTTAPAEVNDMPIAPSEGQRTADVERDARRAGRGRLAKKAVPYIAAAAIAGLGIHEAAGAAGSEESSAAHRAAPIEKHIDSQTPPPATRP